jgi:hypothetical protein
MTALASLWAIMFICRFMNFTSKLDNEDNVLLILQIKELNSECDVNYTFLSLKS